MWTRYRKDPETQQSQIQRESWKRNEQYVPENTKELLKLESCSCHTESNLCSVFATKISISALEISLYAHSTLSRGYTWKVALCSTYISYVNSNLKGNSATFYFTLTILYCVSSRSSSGGFCDLMYRVKNTFLPARLVASACEIERPLTDLRVTSLHNFGTSSKWMIKVKHPVSLRVSCW